MPPWLKLLIQAFDPLEEDNDGDERVWREACWLLRRLTMMRIDSKYEGCVEDELIIQGRLQEGQLLMA